jgi:hypothetical protein
VSDHVWVSKRRAAEMAGLIRAKAAEVEALAAMFPGDLYGGVREQVLACSGELARIADQIVGRDPAPVRGEHAREIGLTTQGWRRGEHSMPRNRGPV